jgi:hypothetical protein
MGWLAMLNRLVNTSNPCHEAASAQLPPLPSAILYAWHAMPSRRLRTAANLTFDPRYPCPMRIERHFCRDQAGVWRSQTWRFAGLR